MKLRDKLQGKLPSVTSHKEKSESGFELYASQNLGLSIVLALTINIVLPSVQVIKKFVPDCFTIYQITYGHCVAGTNMSINKNR